jgi:nicotinamidase-related amidase
VKKALLVIDVQNAITSTNQPHIIETLNTINRIIPTYSEEEVYYIRHIEEGTEFDESKWDSHLSEGLLKVNDQIIKKQYNSAFLGTQLDEIFRKKGIKDIYICGFQTEYCIDATVKTGHFLGYQVFIYRQGHHTFDNYLTAEQLKTHYNLQFQIYAELID